MQQMGAFNQRKSKERMPEPNQEHVNFAWQGAGAWDRWREKNPSVRPELSGANLSRISLAGANLEDVLLRAVDLRGADLRGAILRGAILTGSDLSQSNLSEADLHGATLITANFRGAVLRSANLTASLMNSTVLVDVDLKEVQGLDAVIHDGPSSIGIDTILRFRKNVPEGFLRGAGVPETFIVGMRSFTETDFYSCFISYSNKDEDFAKRLYADLQSKGVRCWFAPKDLPIGSETRSEIDAAIRRHDKLLVILSENSVKSPWVQKEVETAFEKERQQSRIVLFPIRLDDSVMNTDAAWASDIRRMRNIGDFLKWKNHDLYESALGRLLQDLRAEGKAASAIQMS